MAQIQFKSSGSGVSTETSAAALSPLCPATVDAGDILIAHVFWEGTTSAPAEPAGWTLLDGPQLIETTVARHWVFGRIADGSEDGAAVAFGAPSVLTQRGARIYSFSGRISGTITDLVRGFSHLSHATDPQMPTVTTTHADSRLVALVAQNDNNTVSSATGETGGDWTETLAAFTVALTPGFTMQLQTAVIAGSPQVIGTITGGTVATTNDPVGVLGFEIRPEIPPTAAVFASTEESDTVLASVSVVGEILRISWAQLELPSQAQISASLSAMEDGDALSATATVSAAAEMLRISWAQLEVPEGQGVTATLSLTEADDTLSALGLLSVALSLSVAEDPDTLAASASVGGGIAASLSVAEDGDSVVAAGTLGITASLSLAEGGDTLAGSATAPGAELLRVSWAQLELPSGSGITASLTATEAADVLNAVASVEGDDVSVVAEAFSIEISFAPAIADYELTAAPFTIAVEFESALAAYAITADAFSVLASFGDATLTEGAGDGSITVSASLSEGDDTVSALSTLAISAALISAVESADTLTAGLDTDGALTATASLTEEADTVSAEATVAQGPITATAGLVEDGDVLAASAAVEIFASASVLEDADSLTGQVGTPQIAADVAVTESDDTVTASASLAVGASVSITESDDLSSASVSVFIVANASITEEDDDFTGGWGRQLFPAHIGLTNRGRGPRGSSGGGGPIGSSRSKGSITNTEWP
jgi:hypothetical protein